MGEMRDRLFELSGFLVLILVLAGCGGGGGSGEAGDPAAQPGTAAATHVVPEVSVALKGAPAVRLERIQGAPGVDLTLDVVAQGEVERLRGETVHVFVEDPASLFQATPHVLLRANPAGALIILFHRVLDVPGRFEGQLKVHVCLDAACDAEMTGSPMTVPYDVNVLRAVQLDREVIDIALPFGKIPPDQTVTATLPASLLDWDVTRTHTVLASPSPHVNILRSTSPDSATGVVTFKIWPGTTGLHLENFEIRARVRMSDGSIGASAKKVTLRYTVTRDPAVDYVLVPEEGRYSLRFGDPARQVAPNPMVADDVYTSFSVEYISNPPAADGHLLAADWFHPFDFGITGCTIAESGWVCLPTGTYVARLRYAVGVPGVGAQYVYWPITLEVLPP
jgi:hypothetical protein